jgi:hypothetical protein
VSTSPSASATLSSGAQLLLNDGFLPSNLSTATLANATPAQLDAMAEATIKQANVDALFGISSGSSTSLFPTASSESGDSVLLSEEATALLGQTPSASTTSASSILSDIAATLLGQTPTASTTSSTDPSSAILSLL